MVKYLHKKAAFLVVLLLGSGGCIQLQAQASFVAVCPQKKIGKNDLLQIEFRMRDASNVESIDPPSFRNFSVVSGPNEATSSSDINGKVDQSVSVSFVLKPTGPGNYTISPATAKADGKVYHTDPVTVQVTNASAVSPASGSLANSLAPLANFNFDLPDEPEGQDYDDYVLKKGENVHDKIKRDLFIKADISKTSCYVNEPVVVTFKLYTRLRQQTTVTDEPSFNGFSVSDVDLNDHNASYREKYNGRDYNVYVLRKVQLFPAAAGTLTIDPLVTENDITFIKQDYAGSRSGDPFMDMMQNFANAMPQEGSLVQEHATVKSDPVTVTVKALPDSGKPVQFRGAVGNFTLSSSIQKNRFTTDDANDLRLAIAGTGDIQMINPPKISWPQGIDGYDPQISDATDKNAIPLKGTKTFSYPFTVSRPGTYTIPEITFAYFEPQSGTYKVLTAGPFTCTVRQGKGIRGGPVLSAVQAGPAGAGTWQAIRPYAGYLLLAIVVLAALVFWLVKKYAPVRKKDVAEKSAGSASPAPAPDPVTADPLQAAHQPLAEGNSPAFYRAMDTGLRSYLGEKFGIPAAALDRKTIHEEVDRRNIGLGTSLRLFSLLDRIDRQLYAPPSSSDEMSDVYEKTSSLIAVLDRQG